MNSRHWPLLLTPSPASNQDRVGPFLEQSVKDYVNGHTSVEHGYVLGGTAKIGRRAHSQLEAIL